MSDVPSWGTMNKPMKIGVSLIAVGIVVFVLSGRDALYVSLGLLIMMSGFCLSYFN